MNAHHRSLVVTRDGNLLRHVVTATGPSTVEIRFDGHSAAQALKASDFALVVLDDEVLTESERGWMVDECHRRQPTAAVVYVASKRSTASERLARTHGVALYADRPIDSQRLRGRMRRLRSNGGSRP